MCLKIHFHIDFVFKYPGCRALGERNPRTPTGCVICSKELSEIFGEEGRGLERGGECLKMLSPVPVGQI